MGENHGDYGTPLDQFADSISMDLPEINLHSFIVKVWLEETADEAGRATWRGHITHVPSNERRYVQDLDGVSAFIMSYLEKMGVRPGMCWRIREWLSQWKLRWAGE